MTASQSPSPSPARRFRVLLIKPSHYDDDGFVISWYLAAMPLNSLAAVYGLIADASSRNALGSDVAIDLNAIDESNTRVRIEKIIADFRRDGSFGFVCLVVVQSSQYPRVL